MECASCAMPMPAEARFCQGCGAKAPSPALSDTPDPLRDVLKLALGRQYEVSRLLGKGGMGAVYLAHEAALERDVAIKVLPPDRGSTQETRDRFRREARTAAKLSHPNIVPLHTFGDVDGTLYFVMGYVKGESLAARLKREGKLPIEEARRILIEIAEALDYAHKLGIVHRDIKPDNVLIEEATGRAMLTDFGIAKAVGTGQTMTAAGSVLGTPHYMSPEQAQGKADIDARSDLYSLGVMGYVMVSGRLPFEGASPGDVMVQHITKEPPPLSSIASVPVEISTGLTRCLAKDPGQRWRDAESLKRSLTPEPDDDTPPQLDGMGSFVIVPGVALMTLLCMGAWWLGGGTVADPFSQIAVIVACTLILPLIALPMRIRHLGKVGIQSDAALRAVFKPLAPWPCVLPPRLRPKGDVWHRLPPELRQLRLAIAWMIVLLMQNGPITFFLIASVLEGSASPQQRYIPALAAAAQCLSLIITGAFLWRFDRFRRLRGIDPHVGNRLVNAPTSTRALWQRPEIAALLLPEHPKQAEPAEAADVVAAIGVIARRLAEPARAIGREVDARARELANSIDALDKQLAHLVGAFDPGDDERLGGKIAALGPDNGPGDANLEIREILRKQLDAVRNLESRIEDIKTRRARRFELLRGLWLHAVELQAAANDPVRTGDTTDRIQKLFAQIAEHTLGQRPGPASDGATHPFSELPTLER